MLDMINNLVIIQLEAEGIIYYLKASGRCSVKLCVHFFFFFAFLTQH